MQKHLSRARLWALVDGGKWGGRERREGGGEHSTQHTRHNKAQQDTNNTREGREKYYTGES